MIKELDNRGQEKVTPRKLFNEESGEVGSENSQMSPLAEEVGGYSSDGSFRSRSRGRPRTARKHRKNVSKMKGTSKSHRSVRSEARSRSKSKSVKLKPQSVRAAQRKSSSYSGHDTVSDSGNKDPEDHLSIFSAAAEQEEWPMPVWCKMLRQTLSGSTRNWFDSLDPKSVDGFEELSSKLLEEFSQQKKAESAHIKGVPPVLRISAFMHRHGHPELSKKLNDKILKTVDEMWERVRVFIKGEAAADTTEAIRTPRWEKSAGNAGWSEHQNGSRNRSHRRGEGRNMGTCAPYTRREGFTPLVKTPKEILAMDNMNFPPTTPDGGNSREAKYKQVL
ncbi:hypothetical protein Tco_1401177 [Tanacetum coccineum]